MTSEGSKGEGSRHLKRTANKNSGREDDEEPRCRRAAEAAQGVGVGAGKQRWQSGLEQVCACAVRARECVRVPVSVCVSEDLQVGPMRACRPCLCVRACVCVCRGMCDAYVHAFVCVRVVFVFLYVLAHSAQHSSGVV